MDFLTILINSLVLFGVSNFYVLNKSYNIKIPVVLVVLLVAFIVTFPSLFTRKVHDKNLKRVKNGYRLLIVFLINIFLDVVLYAASYFKYQINTKVLLYNLISLVIILNIVFWNGMIRVYLFSKQLGIRYRLRGFLLGLIPIAHIVMLIKMIEVCKDEVSLENEKIKIDMDRKKDEICKTKYPILLVHGIFFRDFEKFNYWGRIPDELIKNGATIYYGNHSSSLSVKDSAEELASRIKEIVEETKCDKVNIIAHSKGGLDSRYAISNLGMDNYVASLSMINTPNHGCVFAEYLLNKVPQSMKDKIAEGYNFTLKKLGDKNPDFIAGVSDLTFTRVEELNRDIKMCDNVYYKTYGSVLKKASGGRFPLNLTNNFVELFDSKNDGLVGIDSFPLENIDFELLESPYKRGISHGDVIDLNRENIKGFDVREFYVKLVNDLKNKGF